MANTHPNSIFRWEDAASLEHACWACPTKANSPRALQTCYGLHSMPCISYHPTMHALGAAHRCSGCVTTREMHEARHREIAELVVEYRGLEETSVSSPDTPAATSTPTRSGRRVLVEIPANVGGGVGLDRRGGRAERDRNKGGQGQGRARGEEHGTVIYEDGDNDENEQEQQDEEDKVVKTDTPEAIAEENDDKGDDDDTTSLSSYAPSSADQSTTSIPVKKPTKAQLRAEKKAKKSAKATSKALKNQNRNLATITSADIEKIARVLHGDEYDATSDGSAHPLATDKTVEDVISRNLAFVKNIQAHKAYLFASVAKGRKEVKERKRLKKRESQGIVNGEETIEMEGVVTAIMTRLGVAPGVVAASATTTANNTSTSTPLRSAANGFASGRKRTGSGLTLATPSSAGSNGRGQGTGGSASRASLAVAVKLRNAIRVDLEKHENEVHARYVRAGGFWRYVGKTVFERMTDFARKTDVATGECWEKKWAREGKSGDAVDDGEDEGHVNDAREE